MATFGLVSDIREPNVAVALAGRALHDGALLDAARLSAARRRATWPRRELSAPVRIMLWALRAYVLLMLVIVALQVARLA